MSRNVRDRIARARTKAAVAPQQTWAPEIFGALLFLLALLSTTGVIG
jgi:F0F1-type ATP synthase membrane subunit c/vacuolar-type H+-ATPase subunit K